MQLIACPDCDLLQELPELPPGAKARCPRCACTVATRMAEPIDLPLALTVTAAIVFIIANTAPLMSLSAVGRYASTTIGGGAKEMLFQGEAITAMIVALPRRASTCREMASSSSRRSAPEGRPATNARLRARRIRRSSDFVMCQGWRDRHDRLPEYPLTPVTSGGRHMYQTRIRPGTAPMDDE